ncbi:MAG: hypothetical protein FWG73_04590 [Planctomycetaceae bacterium]|nr:hypothetical protein [Planctomycetaceae bacterium]
MKKTLLALGTVAILLVASFQAESRALATDSEMSLTERPEELLALINSRFHMIDVPQRSEKDAVAAYVNTFQEIKALAEKGLAGNPTGSVRSDLLQRKAWAYSNIADYEPEMYPEYEAFVKEVEANPNDKEAAMHIRGRFLEFCEGRFWRNPFTEEEFLAHRQSVLEFFDNKEAETYLQLLAVSLVSHSLKLADQAKDRSLALETAAIVKNLLENADDEFNRGLAYRAEAILNKHWASEDGLTITGFLPDGKEFDFASLKGKPVLLILWSNRQRPFSQGKTELEIILPHITELYEKYRSKGFEIVDMCIDMQIRGPVECNIGIFTASDIERQEAIYARGPEDIDWEKKVQTFPWSIHLFPQKDVATEQPVVMRQYDLFGDHQFLLAPDGKVVVSRMGGTYNEEIVKKRVAGLTWEPGRMPQPWEDRFSTLVFEEALENMFSGASL